MSQVPVYSAAKVGKQFFWVVLSHRKSGDKPEDALAEGFAPTKAEAWRAAMLAAWGIAPSMKERPYKAGDFYRDHRGGAEEARSRLLNRPEPKLRHPETAEFQGDKYLYHEWRDDYGVDHWSKDIITKVTDKFVYLLTGMSRGLDDPDPVRTFENSWLEKSARLDRAKLESDGEVWHYSGNQRYHTKASMDAINARRAEDKRIQEENYQRHREETRLSLIGKVCIFCGENPDCYTYDKAPVCSPCNTKACGYYRVPANMIVPFRTIDA